MNEKLVHHIYRKIFLTTALTTFSAIGAAFIDSLIISRFLGTQAVAAEGLAYPFYFLAGIIYDWISIGFNSMASRRVVGGDIDGMNRVYNEGVLLSILVSVFMMSFLIIFAGPVSYIFGARGNSADLLELTKQYLIGLSVGFPALVLNALAAVALRFDNGNSYIMKAYMAGMVADFALDLAAVRLELGMLGVGLASSISAYVSLGILCIHFLKGQGSLRLRFTGLRGRDIREMLISGSGMAVYRVFGFLHPLFINPFVVSVGGSIAMAVFTARDSVLNLVSIPGYGVSDGVYVTSEIAYNMRSKSELLATGRAGHKYAFLYCLMPGIVVAAFSWPLAALYFQNTGSPEHNLLIFALCVGGIKLFLETLIMSRVYFLQAIDRNSNANAVLFLYNFASVIICTVLLGTLFGSYGIMAGVTVSDLVVLILIYFKYAGQNRSLKVTVDDYLVVSDECEVSPGDIIELDIRDLEDCALAGEQVQLFCKGHKVDPKRALYAGLCAEEGSCILRKIIDTMPEPARTSQPEMSDVKLHVTIRDGKIRLHLRFYCRNTSLAKEIKRLRGDHDAFFTEIIGEKIINELSGEVKSYNSMDIDHWIIII